MSMLETAHKSVRRAAELLQLDDKSFEKVFKAEAEHIFELEVNGQKHQAYRVQHSNARGPFKGGVRFHQDVDLDEVRALAMLMSLKTAAAGIPLGGGKGGVAFNPKEYDTAHVEAVARAYVRQLHGHIGPNKDVPAPDVNTDSQVIDWMADEYEKITGDDSKASFTGKTLENGGSEGREAATGQGGMIVLREYIAAHPELPKPLTVAVQGIGNVGFYFAQIAEQALPVRIVAVSDSKRTMAIENFHESDYAISFTDREFKRGIIDDLQNEHTVLLDRDDILNIGADVLVCAALGDSITAENVGDIKAKVVVELANGPVDDDAHEALHAAETDVLPDIIANAGGVIVSYLEWEQNKKDEHWSEADVNRQLEEILSKATRNMLERAKEEDTSLRLAAFENALETLLALPTD